MARGCLIAGMTALLLAAVVAVGAWLFRDDLIRAYAHLRGREVVAASTMAPGAVDGGGAGGDSAGADAIGPDVARRVEDEVIALGRGESEEVDLSPAEVTSWIRYGLEGFFPDYVKDVSASTDSMDHLLLAGRVVAREVPGIDQLGPAAFLLGDTVPVTVTGRLDGLGPGRGRFRVGSVQLGPLPLPDAMRDQVLAALGVRGRGRDGGAASDAVTFPLPEFVTDIAVRNGVVVLRRSGG